MTDTTLKQHERVAFRVIDGSAVLVNPENSSLYWLNSVATAVWEMADGENTLESIARRLTDEFEVGYATALADAESMARAFLQMKLLVESPRD
jgi:hypothetical protein